MQKKIVKTDEEWKKILSPAEYNILRKKATEPPFSGKYIKFTGKGVYVCAACGNELFHSETKYDSGSGWPSFWAPLTPDNIETMPDLGSDMQRTEVLCSRCGSHLGHVFNDGPRKVDMLESLDDNEMNSKNKNDVLPVLKVKIPEPTGKRYCINSTALKLKDKDGLMK